MLPSSCVTHRLYCSYVQSMRSRLTRWLAFDRLRTFRVMGKAGSNIPEIHEIHPRSGKTCMFHELYSGKLSKNAIWMSITGQTD